MKPEDFPTLEAFRTRGEEEGKQLMDFVDHISDERLNNTFHYNNTSGKPFTKILWQAMAHLVNHRTKHRTEAADIPTDRGHSPGDIELIYFFG